MKTAAKLKIKRVEAKLGRKLIKRSHVKLNLSKAVQVSQFGHGIARFAFAPITIPPFSFRSTTINGNSFNLLSGSWFFSGNEQGFMLDNFSDADDRWFFTAWNPTRFSRTVTYAVIAKRKP